MIKSNVFLCKPVVSKVDCVYNKKFPGRIQRDKSTIDIYGEQKQFTRICKETLAPASFFIRRERASLRVESVDPRLDPCRVGSAVAAVASRRTRVRVTKRRKREREIQGESRKYMHTCMHACIYVEGAREWRAFARPAETKSRGRRMMVWLRCALDSTQYR